MRVIHMLKNDDLQTYKKIEPCLNECVESIRKQGMSLYEYNRFKTFLDEAIHQEMKIIVE